MVCGNYKLYSYVKGLYILYKLGFDHNKGKNKILVLLKTKQCILLLIQNVACT